MFGPTLDKARKPLNDENMDALLERVLNERIQLLQDKLKLAINQRDGLAVKYHKMKRSSFQELNEDIEDYNRDIEQTDKSKID